MLLTIAPDRARLADRVRLLVLALAALVAAHTIVYAGQAGSGDRYAAAMADAGHDGWWLPACATILGASTALVLRSLGALRRLEAAARAVGPLDGGSGPDAPLGFRPEMLAIWRRLLPSVIVLFAVQENVEHLAARGRLPGVDVLIGPGSGLALPVLTVVTLAIAAAGALVRWRISSLDRRIRRATELARRPIRPERASRGRQAVGDLAPRCWIVDRLDAGRAPPVAVRP